MAGFKYFNMESVSSISVSVSGNGHGMMQVSVTPDFTVICAEIAVQLEEEEKSFTGGIRLEEGVAALYFRYRGEGRLNFWSFTLS